MRTLAPITSPRPAWSAADIAVAMANDVTGTRVIARAVEILSGRDYPDRPSNVPPDVWLRHVPRLRQQQEARRLRDLARLDAAWRQMTARQVRK